MLEMIAVEMWQKLGGTTTTVAAKALLLHEML